MSNPFEQLQVLDQEDERFQKAKVNKFVKGPQDKRNLKDDKPAPVRQQASYANDSIPAADHRHHHKQEFNKVHNKREPRPQKDIPEGHYLDRRSGTGRVDKPRKEGGGRGNIGNLQDQQNKDKYIKQGGEENVQEEQVQQSKPEEPQGMTLQEYYESKGIDINEGANSKKQAAKKKEINADWIQKEKLTLLQTKEDKKQQDRNKVQIVKHQLQPGANSANEEGAQLLGFQSKQTVKPPQKSRDREDNKPRDRDEKPQEKKREKVVLNADDFPTL